MLPVVSSRKKVAYQMIGHTVAMIGCSLAIVPLAPTGPVYGASAAIVGAWFLWLVIRYTVRVHRGLTGKALNPMGVFHASITYLTLLFVALAVDPFVRF